MTTTSTIRVAARGGEEALAAIDLLVDELARLKPRPFDIILNRNRILVSGSTAPHVILPFERENPKTGEKETIHALIVAARKHEFGEDPATILVSKELWAALEPRLDEIEGSQKP